MFGLIKECAEQFVHFFDHQNQKDLKEIEVKELFRRYTNDVIATTAFGIKYNTLENPDNEFYRMGSEVADFSGLQILKIFLYNLSPTLTRVLPNNFQIILSIITTLFLASSSENYSKKDS